mgnify:CR=1 FL=1
MFKKSLKIGEIAGIPIKIHFSFLLILPFFAWIFGNNIQSFLEYMEVTKASLSLNSYFLGLILAILVFVSVALHELAHSFMARSRGMEINDITLMLLGGVAQMDEISEDTTDEALMALIGPVFSLVFGYLLYQISGIFSYEVLPDLKIVLFFLGQINIYLGIFNLIPAFPTDGGRVLRALIAKRKSYLEATKIAMQIGRTMAFLLVITGFLTGNFILVFIAFYIFMAASQEYQHTLLKKGLAGLQVKDLMTRDVKTVSGELFLSQLLNKMFDERHSGYPVVDNDHLKGMVTMEDIKKVNQSEHGMKKVRQIMSSEIKKMHPDDEIYNALRIISRENIGRLLVVDENDNLVGIITRTDIIKGFELQELKMDIDGNIKDKI